MCRRCELDAGDKRVGVINVFEKMNSANSDFFELLFCGLEGLS